MIKHNFKIGDNVKLKPNYIRFFKQGTKVGKIIGINDKYIRVKYVGADYGFPYKPNEIEYVRKIGEQLMFEFMGEK